MLLYCIVLYMHSLCHLYSFGKSKFGQCGLYAPYNSTKFGVRTEHSSRAYIVYTMSLYNIVDSNLTFKQHL